MAGESTLYSVLAQLTAAAAARRSAEGEALAAEYPPSLRAVLSNAHNRRLANDLHWQHFRPGVLRLGRVRYALPYAHCYRVALDDGGGEIACCNLLSISANPLSVRQHGVIPPFSLVAVLKYEGAPWGYIVGVVPDIIRQSRLVFPDWIEQGSNTGFMREQYYYGLLLKSPDKAGMRDFSNSRPLDGAAAGEWGLINDLGMGLFLDNFMGYFRADESAGLWLYYLDRFVRLAGYNFSLETAASQLDARNDQGEFQQIEGCTPYPWEALGVFEPSAAVSRSFSDEEVQRKLPYGKYEPRFDDQQPFFRFEEFRGYLGQGFMRQVAAPPPGPPEAYRFSQQQAPIGLFREQVGLDGSYCLQSAHSLHFLKRIIIPAPKRVRLWEDQDRGDGADNAEPYRFAGVNGSGPEHKIAGDADPGSAEFPNVRSAIGLSDIHAYACNWKGLHPFHYHKGDYALPEPSQANPCASRLQAPISFEELQKNQWLSRPQARKIRIDHRYGEVDYFETAAGISVLQDGSIVIRDGYGSEIIMTGGSIYLSAAGDVWRVSGRSVIDWAGDDAIVKARNSVDITSSLKDVRLKAEANLEMLSGNGGRGRMLLENRAQLADHDYADKEGEDIGSSGIIFKAPSSEIAAIGQDIYLGTGDQEGGVGSGHIVLDAQRGRGKILAYCDGFDRILTGKARDVFKAGKKIKSMNMFSAEQTVLGSETIIDGGLTNTRDGIRTNGWISVKSGHIATEFAPSYSGFVASTDGSGVMAAIQRFQEDAEDEQAAATADQQELLEQKYYGANRLGNPDTQRKCEFGFRTETQYATAGFYVPEFHWQHLARMGGGSGVEAWEERPVLYQGRETFPYPGRRAWQEAPVLLRHQDSLHDSAAGLDADRSSGLYEDAVLEDWDRATLAGNFEVVAMM